MARNYQYETSPRKIEPDYNVKRKKVKKTIDKQKIKQEEEQRKNNLKAQKRVHYKNIAMIDGIFLMMLVVSYRNSLITEKFNEIQDKKSELASVEKTNGQLEVDIQASLNLSNIEKEAKKQLGMKKLNKNQKVYVTLPKKDYTESNMESIQIEDESNWFEKIISNFIN